MLIYIYLRKWNSNSSKLMSLIQADQHRESDAAVEGCYPVMEDEESYATSQLGLRI